MKYRAASLTQDAIVGLLPDRAGTGYRPERIAFTIWRYYCTDPRPSHATIAADLGVSACRSRQLMRWGLEHIRRRRPLLERALAGAPHGTDLHVALIGCQRYEACWWRPSGGPV